MNNFNWEGDFPSVPKSFHNRLCSSIAQLPTKEEIKMIRKISLRRTLVLAVITAMVLATTAFAIGRVYSVISHSNDSDYFEQLPTADKVQGIIGASPKLVEKFDNGYTFELGTITHVEEMDEDKNVISKYDALDLVYTNDSADIMLTMEKLKPDRELPTGCTQSTYGDTTLYTLDLVTKIVPKDYVKTEQDKLDEAAGKVYFHYWGGLTIQTRTTQTMYWDCGDVSYQLLDRNIPITDGVLGAMARQIIDHQ